MSFSGSPTVSPMTAAWWHSEPLPPSVRACSLAPACNEDVPSLSDYPCICCLSGRLVLTRLEEPQQCNRSC